MNIKKIKSDMEIFRGRYGDSLQRIYNGLVDFIAGYLDISGRPVDGWGFTVEQNQFFYEMMKDTLIAIQDGIEKNGWFDVFGDIFMEILAQKNILGQCFTPKGASDICARILFDNKDYLGNNEMQTRFGKRYILDDPASGSGRLVLSAAFSFFKKTGESPYIICEDVDTTCCKQSAINIALHGWYGEVVCHNTLRDPSEVKFGYIINEGLFPFQEGLPTIRYSENQVDFIAAKFWNSQKQKDDYGNNGQYCIQFD